MSFVDALFAVPHWVAAAALIGWAFAAVAAVVILLVVLGCIRRTVGRVLRRIRVQTALLRLESGTCDGLRRRRVRRLVEELWLWPTDDPARRP